MSIPIADTWTYHKDGRVTFTTANASMWQRAPELEGYECFFVGRHPEYTRWTYRKVKENK